MRGRLKRLRRGWTRKRTTQALDVMFDVGLIALGVTTVGFIWTLDLEWAKAMATAALSVMALARILASLTREQAVVRRDTTVED